VLNVKVSFQFTDAIILNIGTQLVRLHCYITLALRYTLDLFTHMDNFFL